MEVTMMKNKAFILSLPTALVLGGQKDSLDT